MQINSLRVKEKLAQLGHYPMLGEPHKNTP